MIIFLVIFVISFVFLLRWLLPLLWAIIKYILLPLVAVVTVGAALSFFLQYMGVITPS